MTPYSFRPTAPSSHGPNILPMPWWWLTAAPERWIAGYIGEKEYGVFRVLKNYFDPDYNMNPGGTIGLDLKPEEKKFLREHTDYLEQPKFD